MRYPFVSVIVCTLNRKDFLKKCLNNLLNVNYPKSRYEIIIIDGGSIDGTIDMLKKEFPQIRYIIETRPGVSYARNRGLENAKGDIIAFTDDDCIVTRNWLYELTSNFLPSNIGAVGGPVRFLQSIPRKLFVKAALGGYDMGEKKQYVKFLITSNMAIRNEVAQKIKFDVKLGRRKRALFNNEDIDFCERISRMNYKLLYNPKAVVYHDINVERIKVQYILRRAFYAGVSLYIMSCKHTESKLNLYKNLIRRTIGAFFLFLCKRNMNNFYFFIRNFVSCFAILILPIMQRKI